MAQRSLMFTGLKEISLRLIDLPRLNVRRRDITADLTELADSLRTYGLQQPIVVMPTGDRFSVVIGQRRYLAAKLLDWPTIAALILDESVDAAKATLLSFSENIQRRDLSPRDKASACSSLMESMGSVEEVAHALCISPSTVRRWLGYAGVPETVKEFVRPNALTVSQAIQIWNAIDDEKVAVAVAERVANEPIKENRTRILSSAKQLPDRSANAIFRRAEELAEIINIQFDLTIAESQAMEEATQEAEMPADDLAKSVTVDWLEENRYLRI